MAENFCARKKTAERGQMSSIIYFNGNFVPEEEALLPVKTHALHYGTGVFEGIRAYYNEKENSLYIFRLADHYKRMVNNTAILSIALPETVEKLCAITEELVKRNFATQDLYIRPLAYKKDNAVGNFNLATLKDGFFVYTTPLGRHFKGDAGVAAMITTWERVSDKAIPPRGKITGAYANTCLAKTESAGKGFDEAIFVNHKGNIAEASSENIFILKNKKAITPPMSDDILEGVTRNTIMTLLEKELGIEVNEQSISIDDLATADEVFLTGTGAEVNAVTSVDKKPIGNGHVGPVSQKAKELYDKLVHGELKKYSGWLTKVTE